MSVHTNTIGLQDMVTLMTRVYRPRGASVMFLGSVGIGKTTCVRHEIRRLQSSSANFGGISYNAGAVQSIDLTGFPTASDSPLSVLGAPSWTLPDERNGMRGAYPVLCPHDLRVLDGDKVWPHTTVQRHELQREMLRPYSMGIINIDEATSPGDDTVWQPLRQLFLEKRVGEFHLTDGWSVVGTGNGAEDGAYARDMPANMRTALAVWRVQPIASDCEVLWSSFGMHRDFVDFAIAHAGEVINGIQPGDQSQFSTVRSWTEAYYDAMAYCWYAMAVPGAKPKFKSPFAPHTEDFPLPRVVPQAERPSTMSRSEALLASMEAVEPVAKSVLEDPLHISLFYRAISARVGPSVALSFQQFVSDNTDRPRLEAILHDPYRTPQPKNPAVMQSMSRMFVERFHMDHLQPLAVYMIEKWPRPIVASFVTKLARKHSVTIAQSPHYLALMEYSGAAGRMGVLGQA